jgi:hypothetical protein
MTYDNAPPSAPLVRTAKVVRNFGEKRPSLVGNVAVLDRKLDDRKTWRRRIAGETGLNGRSAETIEAANRDKPRQIARVWPLPAETAASKPGKCWHMTSNRRRNRA